MTYKQVHKRYLRNTVSGNYVTLDFLDLIKVAETAVVLSRDKVEELQREVANYLSKRMDDQAYYASSRLAKAAYKYEQALEVLHSLTALESTVTARTHFRLFNLNCEAVTLLEGIPAGED